MAKNSITDYDNTAANNTDIQSVDIDEGCAPSGINNAIRELMADLADVNDGTVPLASPSFAAASLTGNLSFGNNDKAIFGAGSDLQIYHDGSDSYIRDSGSGDLYIEGSDDIRFRTTSGETYAVFNENSSVNLYYDNALKFVTTSTGINVTGTVTADGLAIGTSSPDATLQVGALGSAGSNRGAVSIKTEASDATIGESAIYIEEQSGAEGYYIGVESSGGLFFSNSGQTTPTLFLDDSNNVLVGTTDTTLFSNSGSGNGGIALSITAAGAGRVDAARAGSCYTANRLGSDGIIFDIRKDGSTVGTIGNQSTTLYISSSQAGGLRYTYSGSSPVISPCTTTGANLDNSADLGFAAARFDDIFATNGTIQTSDANEKQQIASLTDAEITAAKAISTLFKTFKWNDKVEAKGDAARTHTGVIAQDVQQAMTDAGLDAGNYAFFISDTWWETQTEVPAVEAVDAQDAVYDEDGKIVTEAVEAVEAKDAYTRTDTYDTAEEAPEGATERTRLGIRYPELLAFVGAATEQRLANIETRLAALEGA